MSKKVVKILSTVLMVVMILSVTVSTVAAITPGDIVADSTTEGNTQIQKIGQRVVGILQTVGVVLSVIILIVLGIKYMLGSSEEKSEYKKSLLPYAIGAALIFAASAFANTIYQFFSNGFA